MSHMLGEMNRTCQNGLDQSTVEDYNEFHFITGIDDGSCIDFSGTKKVRTLKIMRGTWIYSLLPIKWRP